MHLSILRAKIAQYLAMSCTYGKESQNREYMGNERKSKNNTYMTKKTFESNFELHVGTKVIIQVKMHSPTDRGGRYPKSKTFCEYQCQLCQ